ncbi:hypothetical protein [Desertihabitans aurantiacus]|uniref:hypothetical protein n=1 Tax=Desertihabitans aurantiacus TaxID=2282477 RepID=UPI000DF766BA|nr:hypothetical protein [Desertihabitans aurantiacus]
MSTTHPPVTPPGGPAPRHDRPTAAPARTADAPVGLPVAVSLAAVLGSTLVGLQREAPETDVPAPTTPAPGGVRPS